MCVMKKKKKNGEGGGILSSGIPESLVVKEVICGQIPQRRLIIIYDVVTKEKVDGLLLFGIYKCNEHQLLSSVSNNCSTSTQLPFERTSK